NGRQVIKITSTQPVNEPFVDMLLELSWGNGRLVREYTFLLDPAELKATQSAQVSTAAPVDVLTQGTRAAKAPPASAPAPTPAPAAPPPRAQKPAPAAPSASEYQVKAGDTLGKIAGQLKPVDISLDMMLVALYRANPDAFIGKNMNRLKSGQILSVPDADTIKGTGEGEAHGIVVAHAADFHAYRNKLAGQVASAAPDKEPESAQSATGKITAKVQERPTAANEAKDQLKLSKAAPSNKSGAATTEDTIAKDRALADATARVKELEKNVGDLEKLMTVKNKAGTAASVKPIPDLTAPAKTETPAKVETPKAEAPAAEEAKPAVKKPRPAAKKPPPPPPEPSLVDTLMDYAPMIGGALLVALLAAFGLSRRGKTKKEVKVAEEPSILGAPTDQAHSLFAETGGQSVDTNNSVFNSSFAPSASQLDTNEVDPVAEADVYIAYGRDAQAEEILKEALRTHPERYPVRLKLLEIYAARKDQRAFETQASEMYGLTKGQGDDWAQAAALGLSIDPLNPLYANAGASAAPAPSAAETEQQALLSQQLDDALAAGVPDSGLMDMDLDLAADSTPTAVPAAVEEPLPKVEEDHSLDFDLGGLSFEPVTTTDPIAMPGPEHAESDLTFTPSTPAPAPTPAPTEEPSFDMAFDMAFDAPKAEQGEAAIADLAKDFDLPSIPQAPESTAKPEALMDLDAMDFDLPSPTPAPVAEAPSLDAFDLPDLPSAPPAAKADEPQFDMSSIDLDLPSTDAPSSGVEEMAMATVDEGEMSAAHMEMETKLDLAIAYQEIGDKEGARELLDEVIKGGSNAQISKANEMRQKLG
ncbi:MAG: LysM peptidoglycan-binding domain-containing protein, partial [Massilia sp.]|nr:LysM peptidoglycan-binding domain-containing protein [Massilia sp.]